jgi:hypothetical protein
MWLSVLLAGAWWDYSPRLSFPVWELTLMVNDNVASLTSGLWSDNAFGRNNLPNEWFLILVHIDRDVCLIPVGACLQKVLLLWTERLETN